MTNPITRQWLLSKDIKFWHNLIFILHSTSPYFGKLDWALPPQFMSPNSSGIIGASSLNTYQSILNQLADNANPETVARHLMMNLFLVAPDYNRTIITYPPLPAEEGERRIGMEWSPHYPRYYVSPAPNSNYRPLQTEEIQPEDIKMFQQKLQVLRSPFNQRLLEAYQLSNHKIKLIKNKLSEWTKLLQTLQK